MTTTKNTFAMTTKTNKREKSIFSFVLVRRTSSSLFCRYTFTLTVASTCVARFYTSGSIHLALLVKEASWNLRANFCVFSPGRAKSVYLFTWLALAVVSFPQKRDNKTGGREREKLVISREREDDDDDDVVKSQLVARSTCLARLNMYLSDCLSIRGASI